MKHIFIYINMLVCAWAAFGNAHAQVAADSAAIALQAKVNAIAEDPALNQGVVSICAKRADGKVLVDVDSDNMLVPASNMKLISTGAALHTLGADYQFYTKIGYSGEITDGLLDGDLYVIGGGDPTTFSKDSIATPAEEMFGQWEKIVRDAGIRHITGKIVGDGRHFDGMMEHPTWQWSDIGTYYGSGATGLMFYENTLSFSVAAGEKVGDDVNISPYYPVCPWLEVRQDCSTGEAGTGDQLYLYTSELAPVAEIRGTFGVDRAKKRLDCSNKYPEYTCAHYFREYLVKKGIVCEGGVADFRLCQDFEDKGQIHMIDSTASASLKRIVFETNHASNNLYAETLFRTLGKTLTQSACYDSSYVAMDKVLKSLGVNTLRGAAIADGSGLSRQNYMSTDFFCRFLLGMMSSPAYEDYVSTLPSPGSKGTLEYNMKSSPAAIKARIKVKSGSMNGVRCYSGYILPSSGAKEETIVFSIMVNNCTSPTWKVRPLLDKIMATLAEVN